MVTVGGFPCFACKGYWRSLSSSDFDTTAQCCLQYAIHIHRHSCLPFCDGSFPHQVQGDKEFVKEGWGGGFNTYLPTSTTPSNTYDDQEILFKKTLSSIIIIQYTTETKAWHVLMQSMRRYWRGGNSRKLKLLISQSKFIENKYHCE